MSDSTSMTNQSIKRVLLTGSTGQDGSYMADYLLANTPHEVYGMVRRTAKPDYGNLKAALTNPRFKLVVGDLSDPHSIDSLVRDIKPDYLINLGAQAFVKASWDMPALTNDVNAEGVLRCLEAIRRHVPNCRFYNAGTSEEFGKVEYSPQDEKHPPRPQSPYGSSKVAARQHVRVYRESYGLYAIQGWLFNHESKRRGHDYVTRKITLGVARIAAAIKAGQPFDPIELGNLDAKRDWSHAEDFVDGIWRMLNQEEYRPRWAGGTPVGAVPALPVSLLNEYVLASGETHTVREFVEKAFAAARLTGQWLGSGTSERLCVCWHGLVKTASTEFRDEAVDPDIVLVCVNPAFYRPAEVDLLWGDATRARTELGWAPKHSFDDLVREMVRNDLAAVGITS